MKLAENYKVKIMYSSLDFAEVMDEIVTTRNSAWLFSLMILDEIIETSSCGTLFILKCKRGFQSRRIESYSTSVLRVTYRCHI